MKEHYCKYCEKLLFKGDLVIVEIKCPRCGIFNSIKHFSQAYLTSKEEIATIKLVK